jgi:hypothetical protein
VRSSGRLRAWRVTSTIGNGLGYRITTNSLAQQLSFRQGYDWRSVDHHDVPLIHAAIDRPD